MARNLISPTKKPPKGGFLSKDAKVELSGKQPSWQHRQQRQPPKRQRQPWPVPLLKQQQKQLPLQEWQQVPKPVQQRGLVPERVAEFQQACRKQQGQQQRSQR